MLSLNFQYFQTLNRITLYSRLPLLRVLALANALSFDHAVFETPQVYSKLFQHYKWLYLNRGLYVLPPFQENGFVFSNFGGVCEHETVTLSHNISTVLLHPIIKKYARVYF